MKNIYKDKKLELEVRDENGNFVRTHHFFFNTKEGKEFNLNINGHKYAITAEGEIVDNKLTNNHPDFEFIPYD